MLRTPVGHDLTGLYRGAPAVAFALQAGTLALAATGRPADSPALTTLGAHVGAVIATRLAAAHARMDAGVLPAVREYDLISGLTGLGALTLHRHGDSDLLRAVLSYLVRLTEPVTHEGDELPGWWARPDRATPWPGGHGNLGIAHGITGPLALLAMTMRRTITVPGHAEAVHRICRWLDLWRYGSGRHGWWPDRISRTEWRTRTVRQNSPHRPSWCYGTPGITRAQQLGALALGDLARQRAAERTLAHCVNDPRQTGQLSDASLCHGWAGLLQSTWRAAVEDRTGELHALVPGLRARLRRHLDRHGEPGGPGLLEGAAGIHLTLHTTAAPDPPPSGWDACLLLHG
ncbi:lanthionine synthetase C family protein [Streptomyces sp. NPDC055078]